jgi:hypothetical protein
MRMETMSLGERFKNLLFRWRIKSEQAGDGRSEDEQRGKSGVCASCKGKGIVLAGYDAICTEPVERVEPCPDCRKRD